MFGPSSEMCKGSHYRPQVPCATWLHPSFRSAARRCRNAGVA